MGKPKASTKYANVVDYETIKRNEYNLNMPRYVDTYEPKPLPKLHDTFMELAKLRRESQELEKQIFESPSQLEGFTEKEKEGLKAFMEASGHEPAQP